MGEPTRKVHEAMPSRTYRFRTGCGNIYITIGNEEGKPSRCFVKLGKAGGCTTCHTDALSQVIGRAIRAGVSPQVIARDLVGMACDHPAGAGEEQVLSCVDALGRALRSYLEDTTKEA